MKCFSCSETIIQEDAISCARCEGVYHFTCQGMAETTFRRMGSRKTNWRCQKCKTSARTLGDTPDAPLTAAASSGPMGSREEGSSRAVLSEPTNTDIMTQIVALREDFLSIIKEFHNFKSALESNNSTLNSLNDKCNLIESKMDNMEVIVTNNVSRLNDFEDVMKSRELGESRSAAVEEEVNQLKSEVARLTQENTEREQYMRMNNLEITGVPEMKNESLKDIIINISRKLEVPIDSSNINFVRRVASWSDHRRPPKIVVQFSGRDPVEALLAAVRKRRGLRASELGYGDGEASVFINCHLTPANKRLLKQVRELARVKQYQYVWVKHCRIYARKDSGSKALLIRRLVDLKLIL